MKTKHPVHMMVFGAVTSYGTLCLPSSSHMKHRNLHQVPKEGSAGLKRKSSC